MDENTFYIRLWERIIAGAVCLVFIICTGLWLMAETFTRGGYCNLPGVSSATWVKCESEPPIELIPLR